MIINPNNTEHSIAFVPRFDPPEAFVYVLTDTATDYAEKEDVGDYEITTRGRVRFILSADVTNETRYQLTIKTLGGEIMYRGLVIATTQDTQEYQLTNDKYYF
tara:strand:- start:501 stop:809 length:309 start_codon:yes stop_codon:yes gene_type:complete